MRIICNLFKIYNFFKEKADVIAELKTVWRHQSPCSMFRKINECWVITRENSWKKIVPISPASVHQTHQWLLIISLNLESLIRNKCNHLSKRKLDCPKIFKLSNWLLTFCVSKFQFRDIRTRSNIELNQVVLKNIFKLDNFITLLSRIFWIDVFYDFWVNWLE